MELIVTTKKQIKNHYFTQSIKQQQPSISTTFSGCYLMENIGKKQFCFVFDRGLETL